MARYLQFANWRTQDRAEAIDISHRSEREVDRITRGMLRNCDVEGGWFVDEYEADEPFPARQEAR